MARALLDCLVSWHVFIISLLPQAKSIYNALIYMLKSSKRRQAQDMGQAVSMGHASAAGKLVTSLEKELN